MKTNPLVSIIINNYNYDRFLAEAIDSSLNQAYSNVEVIVVDDGSTDNSREILESYGDRIIPVLKSNGGQASSLNQGFKYSKGSIICLLDSDDLFDLGKIEKIVDLIVKNKLLGLPFIIHNAFEAIDTEGARLVKAEVIKLQNADWLTEIIQNYKSFFDGELKQICTPGQVYGFASKYRYIPYIGMQTSSISFSRAMAEKVFPLPIDGSKISADDLIVKAASLLGLVYSTNLTLTHYRVHGNNN